MDKENDILEILGISSREDSFTNIIKYLFDNNREFRLKFSRKFSSVKNQSEADKLKLLIRNSYIPKTNKRILPDIVLYSKELNIISVVEVKIFAGQGRNQLSRYENNIKSITNKLEIYEDVKPEIFYLSVNDDLDVKGNKNWIRIKWEELYNIFDINLPREDCIYHTVDSILSRIKSLKKSPDYESVKNDSFNKYLLWDLWQSPDKRLKHIISSNYSYNKINNNFDIEYYTDFTQTANESQTTIILSKKEWKSDKELEDKNANINNCFDFHIEIKMSVYEKYSNIEIRLDHHPNPYTTTKEMKQKELYDEFADSKKSFIKYLKFDKYKNIKKDYRYNRAMGNYLWILKRDKEIENNESVEDVLDFLNDEIKFLNNKIEVFKEELINFEN